MFLFLYFAVLNEKVSVAHGTGKLLNNLHKLQNGGWVRPELVLWLLFLLVFYREEIRFYFKTALWFNSRGKTKYLAFLLQAKRLYQSSVIWNWKNHKELIKLAGSKRTLIRYVQYLFEIGCACEDENGDLWLVSNRRLGELFGKGELKSIENNNVLERLLSATFKDSFDRQKYTVRSKTITSAVCVDAGGFQSMADNKDIQIGCRGVAKKFGHSSSRTGFRIIHQLVKAGLLRVVKVKSLVTGRWLAFRFEVLTKFHFKHEPNWSNFAVYW